MAKKWSKEEKITILGEVEQSSVLEISRKYEVSSATIYNWRKNYDAGGESALSDRGKLDKDKLHKALEDENRRLKKLLVDRELELEVQKELLKKKFGTEDPRKI